MNARASWRTAILAAAIAVGGRAAGRDALPTPLKAPLDSFPRVLASWRGVDEPPLDADTLQVLGTDQYLDRLYTAPDGSIANVYVGYYDTQRQGDQVHSPQNCLPGNGWQPVARSEVDLPLDTGPVAVNRYVVERDDSQHVVLYWFEGRGRIVASEYLNKWFLLVDGWQRRRSEGALVRLISPLAAAEGARGPTTDALLRLGREVHRTLNGWLP